MPPPRRTRDEPPEAGGEEEQGDEGGADDAGDDSETGASSEKTEMRAEQVEEEGDGDTTPQDMELGEDELADGDDTADSSLAAPGPAQLGPRRRRPITRPSRRASTRWSSPKSFATRRS